MEKAKNEKRGMVHYYLTFNGNYGAGVNKEELLEALTPSAWFEFLNKGEQPVDGSSELGYQLWRNGMNVELYEAYAEAICPPFSPNRLYLNVRIERRETPNS